MPFRMDAHRKSGNVSEKRSACNVLFQVSVMKVLRETACANGIDASPYPAIERNGHAVPFVRAGISE